MATWAIEEQVIPLTGVEGAIGSMGLRVDHPDSSFMIMDLYAGADTYELRFQRNGAFVGWRKIEAPATEALPGRPHVEEEDHPTKAKSKK